MTESQTNFRFDYLVETGGGADPVGETSSQPFQLSFNPALKVEFQGSRVTSDGGLILVREPGERLRFSNLIAQHLSDPRGAGEGKRQENGEVSEKSLGKQAGPIW